MSAANAAGTIRNHRALGEEMGEVDQEDGESEGGEVLVCRRVEPEVEAEEVAGGEEVV